MTRPHQLPDIKRSLIHTIYYAFPQYIYPGPIYAQSLSPVSMYGYNLPNISYRTLIN
jgi:hypothetical protein